jgi:hypothetical protein
MSAGSPSLIRFSSARNSGYMSDGPTTAKVRGLEPAASVFPVNLSLCRFTFSQASDQFRTTEKVG